MTGTVVLPPGKSFLITTGITFECDILGAGATIKWAGGTGTAVTLRTGSGATKYEDHLAILPAIEQVTKTWGGSDYGLKLVNVYDSRIIIDRIKNFSVGMLLTSFGGVGTVYNEIFPGYLQNNKVNLDLSPGDDDSWVNENNFFGGRFHHDSNEGTDVSGTRHIRLASADEQVNNNVFYKPSIEGNTAEFHVECYGAYNQFISPRWEATTPKLSLKARSATNYANSNLFLGGYNSHNIVVTQDSDTRYNSLLSRNGWWFNGTGTDGVFIASNYGSSDDPIFVGLAAGTSLAADPATAYRVAISANYYKGKQTTDTELRLRLDHQNGRVELGTGGTAFLTSIRRGTGSPEGVVTANPGSLFLRTDGGAGTTLYVKESGLNTNTGWVAK